jgi:hypothetical protein
VREREEKHRRTQNWITHPLQKFSLKKSINEELFSENYCQGMVAFLEGCWRDPENVVSSYSSCFPKKSHSGWPCT